ncbi:DNA polymerase beta domain protein region [[Leptolyngbya] sp. PCC 7376]|uniref:nucleotidyltransferase family protein n=1 Tax=[Leptolyngbya] sp. PCC 7376 TaxID=111781 RepID=UPI00029F3846|nr:nucleotidyltransferase family protein [[Leptolyngbya] sp. PCC 7376]AFY40288.1 DNA polymerase beta domain protein region [[Leptolyngbya] sp. PCC 7376]
MKSSPLNQHIVLSTLGDHQDQIERLGVKSLALFGSTARGEANSGSDLDFLVGFDVELTFDLYMDLKFLLEDLFEKNVDLVIKEDLKPQIKETVLAQAIYVT